MISLIWATDKTRTKYTTIGITTSTGKTFTLLDNVNSDNEDNIDKVLNYFDTEFYAQEENYNVSASDHLLSNADE